MLRAAIISFESSLGHQNVLNITGVLSNSQSVRWRRKPRWLPVAKSKLYRVPERPEKNEEERLELLRLHNNYKTQMRSLRSYFHEEQIRVNATSTAGHLVVSPEQEEAEFQKRLMENDAWNEKIAAERNARIAKERTERQVLIEQRLISKESREERHSKIVEQEVREAKKLAKTFIKREDLDAMIEKALANPVDHNFAIDLRENIYHGRDTIPTDNLSPKNVTQ